MASLRVLVTNLSVANRTGTETYVRDLAFGLLRADQTPVVYTPRAGALAEEIRAAAIPVVEDLGKLSVPPDVIHGHHLLETLAALFRFPGVPALFVCHDATAWHDTPPGLDRVRRYVAVDEACRDRLLFEHGVPEARLRVLQQAVDLERFRRRGPLPPRPRRALAFSNYLERSHIECLRAVCRAAGIDLEAAGVKADLVLTVPEVALGRYDLVFAKGRCAWEALAVGAAVVVCGPEGVGPLVSSAELDRLRSLNFGRRAFRFPFSEEAIAAEVARYEAADASAVCERIRASAGLAPWVASFVEIYEEVLDEHRRAPATDPADEFAVASEHLRRLSLEWNRSVGREARRRLARRRWWRRLLGRR
jgi:hypothetical protein